MGGGVVGRGRKRARMYLMDGKHAKGLDRWIGERGLVLLRGDSVEAGVL